MITVIIFSKKKMQLYKIKCFSCSQNQITFGEYLRGVDFSLQLRSIKCHFLNTRNEIIMFKQWTRLKQKNKETFNNLKHFLR